MLSCEVGSIAERLVSERVVGELIIVGVVDGLGLRLSIKRGCNSSSLS